MIVLILLSLVIGILAGYAGLLPAGVQANFDFLINCALCLLLWGIGLEIGGNRQLLRQVGAMGFRIILLPLVVAGGSIAGTLLVGSLLGMPPGDSAALGAGFGWYSLSGVLLAKLHSVELGALAFLTNVSREALSIILIPVVARYAGRYAAVAPGGATTMDVTLPLIVKFVGPDMALVAFFHGLVLSALVPVLVPLLV
ncbi:MAG TPA: lysine exporter LysO family protein [Firmicutes bacterium]|nr:lysine exporter LysO family protein [Bacillota bacterium]